jgi:hypothetical protein
MVYTVEIASSGMMFIRGFMKIGLGIQVIYYGHHFKNMKGCSVVTDGKNL